MEQTPHQNVTFPSAGGQAHGYLALPEGGYGPGVVVVQEWWGLTGHIKDVADRLAAEGFVALAPDLYGGSITHDRDEAARMMARLPEDGPFVVGLPGNPLAAMTSIFTVAQPLLAKLHGDLPPATRTLPAAEELPGQKVTALVPGYLRDGTVFPRDRVGANMLRGLAHADVIAVVPPGGVAAGQDVEVVPLPWR